MANLLAVATDRTIWDIFVDEFATKGGYITVLNGLGHTMLIALFGLIIGIVIGCIIATFKVAATHSKVANVVSKICDAYVAVFRGTPIVVQLLVIYYILFPAMGILADSLIVAIVTFGMNSGAYVSEIMRGGIISVDSGQMEAGRCVGLSFTASMFKIVLPQAIKNVLPTLGNELIALVKDTSVVGFIATLDLTQAFKRIASSTYEYIIPYLILALCYFVIVMIITIIVRILEKRLKKNEARR